MPKQQKTHREVKDAQMSGRHLADYMAASDQRRRSIIRECKYQPIARIVQHDEAKRAISDFLCGDGDLTALTAKAQALRDRLTDDDFERDVLDYNADYIASFVAAYPKVELPAADMLHPGSTVTMVISDVKVRPEIHFRLRRLTKTNKIRVGAGMLRYSKGKALALPNGEWQSALLLGYLREKGFKDGAEPEGKLCITLDAVTGACHPAPSNSIKRFNDIKAACQTIAELWPNIPAPLNAIL